MRKRQEGAVRPVPRRPGGRQRPAPREDGADGARRLPDWGQSRPDL